MMKIKNWVLIGALFFGEVVFADEVTNVLNKAIEYESKQSCQYTVRELYEDGSIKEDKTRRVLKKGQKELSQTQEGDFELNEGDVRSQVIDDKVIASKKVPDACRFLLKEYQAGRAQAKVKEQGNRITLKGKREDIRFEIEFLKEPPVILKMASEDDKGLVYTETRDYEFSKNEAIPKKKTIQNTVYRSGKRDGFYKKTFYYTDYEISEELNEEDVSTKSIKEKVFKKLKIGGAY